MRNQRWTITSTSEPKPRRRQPQPPAVDHKRLTPLVEESIRARIAENPHYAPTIQCLLREVDALREELAALKGEQHG